MNFLFKTLEVASRWQIPYGIMVAFRLSYLVLIFHSFLPECPWDPCHLLWSQEQPSVQQSMNQTTVGCGEVKKYRMEVRDLDLTPGPIVY